MSGLTILAPSGRRRRLYGIAIGTGFGRPDADLKGPPADRETVSAWAAKRGYDRIRYICDGEADPLNVVEHLSEAVSYTQSGDALIVHISGHGALNRAGRAGIVLAGALKLSDFDAGLLLGAQFREIAGHIPAGAFVGAIPDVCHADGVRSLNPHGPLSRPRFIAHPDGVKAQMLADMAARNYAGIENAFSSFGMVHNDRGEPVFDELLWDVFLPACGRLQTAADSFRNGRYCGAWTDTLFEALAVERPIGEAVAMAQKQLVLEAYTQIPAIDGGEYHKGRPLP